MSVFYDYDGKPIDAGQWEQLRFGTGFRIALDHIKDADGRIKYTVSTVWKGIDTDLNNPPLIYETLATSTDGTLDYAVRYPDRDKARAGHATVMIELTRGELPC